MAKKERVINVRTARAYISYDKGDAQSIEITTNDTRLITAIIASLKSFASEACSCDNYTEVSYFANAVNECQETYQKFLDNVAEEEKEDDDQTGEDAE